MNIILLYEIKFLAMKYKILQRNISFSYGKINFL